MRGGEGVREVGVVSKTATYLIPGREMLYYWNLIEQYLSKTAGLNLDFCIYFF